jgi:hypothetical protein
MQKQLTLICIHVCAQQSPFIPSGTRSNTHFTIPKSGSKRNRALSSHFWRRKTDPIAHFASLRKKSSNTQKCISDQQRANFLSHPQLFAIAVVEMETDAIKMVLPMGRAGGVFPLEIPTGSITYLSWLGVVLVESQAGVARVAGRSPRRHRRGH